MLIAQLNGAVGGAFQRIILPVVEQGRMKKKKIQGVKSF